MLCSKAKCSACGFRRVYFARFDVQHVNCEADSVAPHVIRKQISLASTDRSCVVRAITLNFGEHEI